MKNMCNPYNQKLCDKYKIINTQPEVIYMIPNALFLIIRYNWKLYKTILYSQKL